MKKLFIGALCAMLGVAAYASNEAYHVYKLQFNAKTTDAKGITASPCGDGEYCYRDKRSVKIEGILAGCGCKAINAKGECKNAILYLWDATRKLPIKNVEVSIPWTVQRVGKNATVVEHFSAFKATYGEDDRYGFEITLSGFGTYKANKKDATMSNVSSISGNFAGVALAPLYVKPGVCTACYVEPDETYKTVAFKLCEGCVDCCGVVETVGESEFSDYTPFFGTYKVSYDSSKSSKISKNGFSAKAFGLPSYVGIDDYVATNIGEDL